MSSEHELPETPLSPEVRQRMRSLRLLVIANTYPDAAITKAGSTFIREQVEEIAKHVESVTVLSPTPIGIHLKRGFKQEPYRVGNVRVEFLPYLNFPLFYFVGRRAWVRLATRRIRKFIRDENLEFDLIHAHMSWPSGAIGVELKREFGVPLVITEHFHKLPLRQYARGDRLLRETYEEADLLIRVNPFEIETMQKFAPRANIDFISNGFDPAKTSVVSKAEARARLGIETRGPLLFTLGTLLPKKGHIYLLEAVRKLRDSGRPVQCFVGGEGYLQPSLRKWVLTNRLSQDIVFLGHIPNHELNLWFRAADLFVLPSIHESFGIVQLEALACGTPVVASATVGSRTVVSSPDVGILTPIADSTALAAAIEDGLMRRWDGDVIRNFAWRFTWAAVGSELLKRYHVLLTSGDQTDAPSPQVSTGRSGAS
ncbi:MAG TPA: glycosyltransferase [Candidatus Thermoplasmatota archaeon]|nr:glycosyltransferase [Candidatus Thermoplasmatota archaeon]